MRSQVVRILTYLTFVVLIATSAFGSHCESWTFSNDSLDTMKSSGESVLFEVGSYDEASVSTYYAPEHFYAVTHPNEGSVTVWRVDGGEFDPITGALNPDEAFSAIETYSFGGGRPTGIAAGDFNDDGLMDLAVTLNDSDKIVVFETYYDSYYDTYDFFYEWEEYTTGDQPRAIAVGDFDDDYGSDLVVTNHGSGSARVFFNDGYGGFSNWIDVSTGQGPWGVDTGYFNDDYYADFAVANHGIGTVGTTVSVFMANASSPSDAGDARVYGFAPSISFVRTNYNVGSRPRAIAVGNFDYSWNGDDLIVANYASSNVSVLLNTNGSFAPPVAPAVVSSGGTPVDLAVIDASNEGEDDFVVVLEGAKQAKVFKNDGAGHFAGTSPVSYALGVTPTSVVVGDLNGQADDFIVAGNAATPADNIRAYIGNVRPQLYGYAAYDPDDTPFDDSSISEVGYNAETVLAFKLPGYLRDYGPWTVKWKDIGTTTTTPQTTHSIEDAEWDGYDFFFRRTVNPKVTTTYEITSVAGLGGCAETDLYYDTVMITVTAGSTSLTLTGTPAGSSVYGQLVKLTAKVSGATLPLTGSVQFYDGITPIGSPVLVNTSTGLATLNVPGPVSLGAHTFNATFTGTGSYAANGTSNASYAHTVNQADSTTTLASSKNPQTSGLDVTFTATVNPKSPATGTPTGSVSFRRAAAPCPVLPGGLASYTEIGTGTLSNKQATLTVNNLAAGAHCIIAVYAGSTEFKTSNSAALTQNINAGTTTAITASNPNGTAPYGTNVMFTAVVTNSITATPSGTMKFYDGTSLLGDGVAGTTTANSATFTFSTTALTVGSHQIKAKFSSTTHGPSESDFYPYTITKESIDTIVLTSLTGPTSVYGGGTLQATVTGPVGKPVPGGTVTLFRCTDNSASCQTYAAVRTVQLVSNGTTSVASFPLHQVDVDADFSDSGAVNDPYFFIAVYNGNLNYEASDPSDPPLEHQVIKGDTNIAIKRLLESSTNPSIYCDPIQFDVTVTAFNGAFGHPQGQVDVDYTVDNPPTNTTYTGGVVTGGNLNGSGNHRFSTRNLIAGVNTLSASFPGSRNWNPATNNPATIEHEVLTAATEIINETYSDSVVNGATVVVGELITFTGQVVVNPARACTFTGGTVTVTGEDPVTEELVTRTLPINPNGTYSVALAFCTAGTKSIDIEFNSDDAPQNFTDSEILDAHSIVVGAAPTSTTLTSPALALLAQQIQLSANVDALAPSNSFNGVDPTGCGPAGTVTFAWSDDQGGSWNTIGTPVAIDSAGNATSIMFNVGGTVDTDYRFRAVYTDADGNFSTSNDVNSANVGDVVVDITSPAAASIAYIGGTIDFSANLSTSNGQSIDWSGTNNFTFELNGGTVATVSTTGTGTSTTATYNGYTVPEGTVDATTAVTATLSAKTNVHDGDTDSEGNIDVQKAVTVVDLTNPGSNDVGEPIGTLSATVSFSAGTTDDIEGATVTFEIYNSGNVLQDSCNGTVSSGSASCDPGWSPTTAAAGYYVVASIAAGTNYTADSDTETFSVVAADTTTTIGTIGLGATSVTIDVDPVAPSTATIGEGTVAITVQEYRVASLTLNNAGTGYTAGDDLTVTINGVVVSIEVDSVSSGAITAFTVNTAFNFGVNDGDAGVYAASGGTGANASFSASLTTFTLVSDAAVAVSGGSATSSGFTTDAGATYRITATYSGTGNYNGSSDGPDNIDVP